MTLPIVRTTCAQALIEVFSIKAASSVTCLAEFEVAEIT